MSITRLDIECLFRDEQTTHTFLDALDAIADNERNKALGNIESSGLDLIKLLADWELDEIDMYDDGRAHFSLIAGFFTGGATFEEIIKAIDAFGASGMLAIVSEDMTCSYTVMAKRNEKIQTIYQTEDGSGKYDQQILSADNALAVIRQIYLASGFE